MDPQTLIPSKTHVSPPDALFDVGRGLPVERYSREEVMLAYWGLGLHWGPAKSNNAKGHLIGHIKDIGLDPAAPTTRLFATCAAQPFHNDAAGGFPRLT